MIHDTKKGTVTEVEDNDSQHAGHYFKQESGWMVFQRSALALQNIYNEAEAN
jgi:hypothetical protein